MADHYNQCSVLMPRPAGDEASSIDAKLQAWLGTIRVESEAMQDGEVDYTEWDSHYNANLALIEGPEKRVLIFTDGGDGSIEAVLSLAQRYLADLAMSGIGVPVSFAWWCSKPRPGNAGGGEVVVTANEILRPADARRAAEEAGVELIEAA